jgi:hypothetical protein
MTMTEVDLWGNAKFHEEARATDPVTSHVAAKMPFKRDSQRHLLLKGYYAASASDQGMTDEEAARWAGIRSGCPWKRCSELREAGLILPTGQTRLSSGGAQQRVCRISSYGASLVEKLEMGQ